MSTTDTPTRWTRHRPRFTVSTVLFVFVIVSLALTVYRQRQAVEPMRQEIRRLRGELGHLVIDDPTKTQHRLAELPDDGRRWRWRLYLPPKGEYSLNVFSGLIPTKVDPPEAGRFAAAVLEGEGRLTTRPLAAGEFQLIMELRERGGRWNLLVEPGGVNQLLAATRTVDWQPSLRPIWNGPLPPMQRAVEAGQPLLLAVLSNRLFYLNDGRHRLDQFSAEGEGFVVWIEQRPPKVRGAVAAPSATK